MIQEDRRHAESSGDLDHLKAVSCALLNSVLGVKISVIFFPTILRTTLVYAFHSAIIIFKAYTPSGVLRDLKPSASDN